jgi:hypothetical protein
MAVAGAVAGVVAVAVAVAVAEQPVLLQTKPFGTILQTTQV